MADDIQALGESLEDLSVTVAVNHLLAVPKSVHIFASVMNRRIEPQPAAVDRIAPVDFHEEVVGLSRSVVGLVNHRVSALRAVFAAHELAWQRAPMLHVVDRAAFFSCGNSGGEGETSDRLAFAPHADRKS